MHSVLLDPYADVLINVRVLCLGASRHEPDMQKPDTLVGRLVGDVGVAVTGALVVLAIRAVFSRQ